MKLASVNTRMDLGIENLVSKDVSSLALDTLHGSLFLHKFVAFEVF